MPTGKTEARAKKLVLIIDENADHRFIACVLLEHSGYAALTADSLDAGRQCIATHSPDVILLGLSMPDETGASWLQALEAGGDLHGLCVVLYTSFLDVYAHELQAMGIKRIINKNASPIQFVASIEEAIRENCDT